MKKGRVIEGTVISDKSDKTISVIVGLKFSHQLYKRSVIRRKKYKAHDEQNSAKVGDRVRIIETRPYSKEKHFKLIEIIK
ncbi:MAG: 30S ribosomal protein S17 [Candidatus Omnitrophica bacterium]|nr:30S ribosomal protein S17 [Candidatus Omnitrophota bacterium]